MKAWRVVYSQSDTWVDATSVVIAPTIIAAIRKASAKLHLGPHRINAVTEIGSNSVILSA